MNKVYDFCTWVWHKVLHVPIRLREAVERRVKNPELTVIFLHGISATSDTWRSTFRQLTKNPGLTNVRLIALDLLGFGKSLHASWLDYDYLDYEKALDAAIKRLYIRTPIVLVGHSMGSLIAADYVVNYTPIQPISQLILVSPPVLMSKELAQLPDRAYTKTYSSLSKIAHDVPAAAVVAGFMQRFTSFRSAYIKTPAFAKSMEQIILNPKNYQTFTKIRIPATIIHGHFDPLVLGANLRRAAKANSHYLTYRSVIGQHDISVGKRAKIETVLKKALKDARQA